jgi:hypothetical protein
MKNIFIIASLLILSNSARPQSVTDLVTTNFISLTVPQAYEGDLGYLNLADVIEIKKANLVKHDYTYLSSFPNLVSSVTLYQVDKDGSLSLIGNSLSVKNSTYIVIYDYTQTQTIQVNDTNNKISYYALIGVSVRMVARVTTKAAGLNLTNLFGLGMAANNKKVEGSLEVRANGINSLQINSLIPVTTDLSPSSISNALQAVATIKSHIYDKETKITPQFLAFSAIANDKTKTKFDFKSLSEKLQSIIKQ